jgi:hypothetical protein
LGFDAGQNDIPFSLNIACTKSEQFGASVDDAPSVQNEFSIFSIARLHDPCTVVASALTVPRQQYVFLSPL